MWYVGEVGNDNDKGSCEKMVGADIVMMGIGLNKYVADNIDHYYYDYYYYCTNDDM